VVIPGGIIRVAVPDVRYHVDRYIADGDADGLLARLYLTRSRPKTWREKAEYLLVGDRQPDLAERSPESVFVEARNP
jgi:hypothetical protein